MVAAYFASKSKSGKKVTGHFEDTISKAQDFLFGTEANTKKEYKRQKEFAQMGIQWKVADARAAGIHPLFALGAQTLSYSPQVMQGETGFLRDMGQNVARAAMSGMTRQERAFSDAVNALTLKRMSLENNLLESQISNINNSNNPPMPDPNRPGFEDGLNMDYTHVQTKDGGYAVVPSQAVKQLIEDMPVQEAQWFVRNLNQKHPPKQKPKDGHVWEFNPVKSEWYETPKNDTWFIKRSLKHYYDRYFN